MKNIVSILIYFSLMHLSCNRDSKKLNDYRILLPESESFHTKVTVQPTERKTFEYNLKVNGKIRATKSVVLRFPVGGIIENVEVKNGSYINKNELICNLDNIVQKLAYRKSGVEYKERELEYKNQLLGFIRDTIENSEIIENLKYTSGLAQAEISLSEANLKIEQTLIRANLSGLISGLEIKPGNKVVENDIVCNIYSPRKYTVIANVIESELDKLEIGQKAEVYPLASLETVYKAILSEIDPQVNEEGLTQIKLEITSTKGLLPGMNARIIIKIPYENTLVIPKEALVVRSGKSVVFTEENGLAKWNYVETGSENDHEIAIKSGLQANEKVIITNNLQLEHDSPVEVRGVNSQSKFD